MLRRSCVIRPLCFPAAFLFPKILGKAPASRHIFVRVVLMSIFDYIHYCSVCAKVDT